LILPQKKVSIFQQRELRPKKLIDIHFKNRNQSNNMTYRLTEDWATIIEDVRAETLTSPTTASWSNGLKHGLHEGSVSRDIVSFMNRQIQQTATREKIIECLPTAFQQTDVKTLDGSAQEYLRELVKMGILDKIQ
jgi:hypothetical protein